MNRRKGRPTLEIPPGGMPLSAWAAADVVQRVEQLAQETSTSRADVVRAAIDFALAHDDFYVFFLEVTPV